MTVAYAESTSLNTCVRVASASRSLRVMSSCVLRFSPWLRSKMRSGMLTPSARNVVPELSPWGQPIVAPMDGSVDPLAIASSMVDLGLVDPLQGGLEVRSALQRDLADRVEGLRRRCEIVGARHVELIDRRRRDRSADRAVESSPSGDSPARSARRIRTARAEARAGRDRPARCRQPGSRYATRVQHLVVVGQVRLCERQKRLCLQELDEGAPQRERQCSNQIGLSRRGDGRRALRAVAPQVALAAALDQVVERDDSSSDSGHGRYLSGRPVKLNCTPIQGEVRVRPEERGDLVGARLVDPDLPGLHRRVVRLEAGAHVRPGERRLRRRIGGHAGHTATIPFRLTARAACPSPAPSRSLTTVVRAPERAPAVVRRAPAT